MLRLMTSVAKPSLDRFTKALALAGAFVAFGCGNGNRQFDERGREWVHRGAAQGTTYTIKKDNLDELEDAGIKIKLED